MSISLTQILQNFLAENDQERITFGDILETLGDFNLGASLLVFSLPIFIPLPPPLPSIIAFPLILISIQLMMGRSSIWLPYWLTSFSFSKKLLYKSINFMLPHIAKLETKLHPRISSFFTSLGKRAIGLFCLLFAISILVPLPLTNLMPGLAIICMSIGLLSYDGNLILIGCGIGILGIGITIAILIGGTKIFIAMFELFRQLKH